MPLVIDASAALYLAASRRGFGPVAGLGLVAPPLLWSETTSSLHERLWRGEVSGELAKAARSRLTDAPIERREPTDLHEEAWRVAEELGWAKTYDAEYVALARILGAGLLTRDERLMRGAARLVATMGPGDLPRRSSKRG